MICYYFLHSDIDDTIAFQTKLTYGMICYDAAARALQGSSFGFKLS